MVRISNIRIIEILQRNSREPFVKIAKELEVSETAIRKKIKKLEKDGIIRRYTIELNPRKLGFQVDALIGMDTEPEYFIPTINKLKRMRKIIHLYSSSGDHMILMRCWFKNSDELGSFIKKLYSIKGVKRICPAIILEEIK